MVLGEDRLDVGSSCRDDNVEGRSGVQGAGRRPAPHLQLPPQHLAAGSGRRQPGRPARIHDLRHTAVALWIAAGASPKEVAARAGHTSVSFVLDRYGHLFPEADTALRARLDSLFRAATEHRRNTVA